LSATRIADGTAEEFEDELQRLLAHLYDPDYRPSRLIYAVTGCDPRDGVGRVQSSIARTIEELQPSPALPPSSRGRRIYDVLHHRYVFKLTQEQTAERLSMSVRHLNRVQREAIHALARQLWEQALARRGDQGTDAAPPGVWRTQVRQELASLEGHAGDATADLRTTVLGVLRIARLAIEGQGVSLEAEEMPADLRVAFHPSALRQVLLSVTSKLAQEMSSGAITWCAKQVGGRARITLSTCPALADRPIDVALAQELLSLHGGSTSIEHTEDRTSVVIELPLAAREKVSILAIDDNPDLISLYQSYCIGTPYEIVHLREGQRLFEAIETSRPDIILLDVMLPDVDGWDLLLNLHADPSTRSIPIIVCSVVTDEQLALTLGASLYLRKPVWRQQLIGAFDRVLSQAATASPTDRGNSSEAC